MMTRKNELLLIDNLEKLRDNAIKEYEIEDKILLADIELVLMELCEFGGYIEFNTEKYKIFCESELIEFLEFYTYRGHVNCIVEPPEAQYIVNLLFNLKLDIF